MEKPSLLVVSLAVLKSGVVRLAMPKLEAALLVLMAVWYW
jgi:hypothetical protein